MDVPPTIVNRILLPLAIIEDKDSRQYTTISPQSETYSNSPQPPVSETWSIDGGGPAYFRFFAIPNFGRERPPLQVFVIVPLDQMAVDPGLVESLQLNSVFSSTKAELPTLPLAKHLIRALSSWSFVYPDFKEAYLSMPYGSHIVVENLHEDVRQMRIHFSPSYALEHEWLSVPIFETQTGLDLSSLIDLLDWTKLELDRHLHDSISLVQIPSKTGSQLMVYKAVTEDVQYMYHEIRTVLSMKEHPRVIARPRYLVVKQCRFGGKVGICGFVLEYHPHGSLQTALQAGEPISLLQKLYWAQQLTVVLSHIRDDGPGFYSDLKPTNILLKQTGVKGLTAPLLIDFEQRGSWYSLLNTWTCWQPRHRRAVRVKSTARSCANA
ncbi:hypothetical protein F4782DRAFT_43453 [Xylaria castorea]|nr:hypothetical protein F4782DRAFT_43453 [Xylaria castorea]